MAASLGASSVEIDARTEIHPAQLSDTGLRQLRKMLDDLDLKVSSLRFQTRRGYDVLDDLDRRVEATKETLKLAYRLGASVVVNSIGQTPEDESDPRWITLQQVMDDLGRYGAKAGAFLAAETGSESGSALAKLLNSNTESFTAVAFNPGQLIINQHSASEAVDALLDRIHVVYAVDGVLDLAAGRGIAVPLGQGSADFPEFIGKLENIHYGGRFVVGRVGSNADEVNQAIRYLREL
jgi:sugar phosphate isomerase/epimerase